MLSSISSLSQLDMRSSSPSPFTPSAGRSRSPPSPNATGVLQESSAFHETVDVIKKGHLEAARRSLKAGPLRDELEEEIERDCDQLREFLYAAQVSLRTVRNAGAEP
jgi:aspartate kinase